MPVHSLKPYLQETNASCTATALAMLISHYGSEHTPDRIIDDVPVAKDEMGNEIGTVSQNLATWCLGQGYEVDIYTFDCLITDLSWARLPPDAVLDRLRAVREVRNVPAIGKEWSQRYVDSYVDFISSGGSLHIKPYATKALLDDLLVRGPVFINICAQTFFNSGRKIYSALRQDAEDDVSGKVTTHSMVVYGLNQKDEYMIADPWSGLYTATAERLLAGITAAQIECDNLIFVVRKSA